VRPSSLLPAALVLASSACGNAAQPVPIRVLVENVSPADAIQPGTPDARAMLLPPGVWLVTRERAPLFEVGARDRGEGLERLAEDGDAMPLAASLDAAGAQSDLFSMADVTYEVGAIDPGEAFVFETTVLPGDRLHLATMLGESNDWFFATSEDGIALFGADGLLVEGDATSAMGLYDLGTEVDQELGAGPSQAPRQGAPDTGTADDQPVTAVERAELAPARLLRVRISRR
jgi:hypothetical protein